MTMDWQVISLIFGIAGAWSGILLWVIKWLLDRTAKHSDSILQNMQKRIDEHEKDLRSLIADLPDKYVRRDDWVRMMTNFESKVEGLAVRVQNDLSNILKMLGNKRNDN